MSILAERGWLKRLLSVAAVIVTLAVFALLTYWMVTDHTPHCTVDPDYGDTCQ